VQGQAPLFEETDAECGSNSVQSIAMFLIHTQTGGVILLQRVIFQIYKNKERAFWDIWQGAVAIYTKTAAKTTTFAAQFVIVYATKVHAYAIYNKSNLH
jgi:hypothetical protein